MRTCEALEWGTSKPFLNNQQVWVRGNDAQAPCLP